MKKYNDFMKTHYTVFSKLKNREKGINMLVKQFNLHPVTCETLFNNFAYKEEITFTKKEKENKKLFEEQFYGGSKIPYALEVKDNLDYLIPDQINVLENNKLELIFKSKV